MTIVILIASLLSYLVKTTRKSLDMISIMLLSYAYMRISSYFGGVVSQDFIKPFKALSDETRLRILNIVVQQECCVCEVMQALEISQSRASRNLRILEEAGFLKSRRVGAWVHYSLRDSPADNFAVALAKMTGSLSNKDAQFQKDKVRLNKAMRLGDACAEISKCGQKAGKQK